MPYWSRHKLKSDVTANRSPCIASGPRTAVRRTRAVRGRSRSGQHSITFTGISMTLTARPPREVSLYLSFMSRPVSRQAHVLMTYLGPAETKGIGNARERHQRRAGKQEATRSWILVDGCLDGQDGPGLAGFRRSRGRGSRLLDGRAMHRVALDARHLARSSAAHRRAAPSAGQRTHRFVFRLVDLRRKARSLARGACGHDVSKSASEPEFWIRIHTIEIGRG